MGTAVETVPANFFTCEDCLSNLMPLLAGIHC